MNWDASELSERHRSIFSHLHYLPLLLVTFCNVSLTVLYFIFSEIAVHLHTTDLLCCVGFLCLSFVALFRRQSSSWFPCLVIWPLSALHHSFVLFVLLCSRIVLICHASMISGQLPHSDTSPSFGTFFNFCTSLAYISSIQSWGLNCQPWGHLLGDTTVAVAYGCGTQ